MIPPPSDLQRLRGVGRERHPIAIAQKNGVPVVGVLVHGRVIDHEDVGPYSVPTPAIEALSRAKNVGEGAVVGIVRDVGSGATQITSGPPRAVGCGAAPPPALDANSLRGCFVFKTSVLILVRVRLRVTIRVWGLGFGVVGFG